MLPFVLSIPHSARAVPPEVQRALALTEDEVLDSVDVGTRELFEPIPACAVVAARWNRLVIDLNRAPDHAGPNGLIAEVDYHERQVHRPGRLPDAAERARRLAAYYRPYHEALATALEAPTALGLIDCHSLDPVGPAGAPDTGRRRPDVVLGNNGDDAGRPLANLGAATCPLRVLRELQAALVRQEFSVSLNVPYAGGYITRHYGAALVRRGRFAVQVELNKGLFGAADLRAVEPDRVIAVRHCLQRALEEFAASIRSMGTGLAI